MNKEHTEYLFKTYPKLYAGHTKPLTENLMAFGFECGDGWFALIDALSAVLTSIMESDKIPVKAIQVKEKYGELRFYTNTSSDSIDAAIRMAEEMSGRTCEKCGSTVNVTPTECGWVTMLCPTCHEKDKEQPRV